MNSQYYSNYSYGLLINYLIILITNLNFVNKANSYDLKELLREKRYLIYPNPLDSETKVQVLFGLGLPMESDVSVILGYVLKCNYNLPYNSSSSLTAPYVTRKQRDAYNDNNNNDNDNKIKYVKKNNVKSFKIKSQQSLLSRWDLYRILESALGSFGSPGKVCLLRAVCEAAELPFDRSHGLLGELLHTLLTPSSTSEYPDVYEDRQYLAAENIGKNSLNKLSKGQCKSIFRECIYSPLDYFTL